MGGLSTTQTKNQVPDSLPSNVIGIVFIKVWQPGIFLLELSKTS